MKSVYKSKDLWYNISINKLEKYGCVKIFTNNYKLGRLEFRVINFRNSNHKFIECQVNGRLHWAEYRSLPHYSGLSVNLNIGDVSDKDIINYINNCKEYEKEYIALENTIPTYTFEEYKAIIKHNTETYKKEYELITKNLNWDIFLIFSNSEVIDTLYDIAKIKEYSEYTDEEITTLATNAFNYQSRNIVKFEHSPKFERLVDLRLIINY